jgi:nucleotide-binding universal stress UspA family protein
VTGGFDVSYRTIVAIIQTPSDNERLLQAIVPLASRLGSHIVGVHAEALPMPMESGMVMPDLEFVTTASEANRSRAAALEAHFSARLADAAISSEWRAVESFSGDSAVAARAAARTADLIIASEASDDTSNNADTDALLYDTGRPLLLVPVAGMKEGPFAKVLVAWNGTREAARAAFDALPFIVEAEETTVVTVDAGTELVNSASQLAAALARHGANASVIELAAKGRPVADVIAAQVQMSAADLLVMGAYGHSRLREFLFGGVTRSLLEAMPVATFMSR